MGSNPSKNQLFPVRPQVFHSLISMSDEILERNGKISFSHYEITDKVIKERLNNSKRKINQYLLIETLGQGSFGKVELCQDVNTKKLYVCIYKKKYLKNLYLFIFIY